MKQDQIRWGVAICGVVVFVGVLLPWVTVDMPQFMGMGGGSHSENGTSAGFDAGLLILLLGIAAGIAAGLVASGKSAAMNLKTKPLLLAALGCLGLAAILTLVNFFKDFGMASRGFGLWLTFLASLGGTALAFLAAKPYLLAAAASKPAGGGDEGPSGGA